MSRYSALFVFGLGLIFGCSKSSSQPDGGEAGVPCAANVATTSGNAATITSGKSVEDKICYQNTSKWYVIDVPSGSTLLDIAAGYSASANSPVQLEVQVWYKTGTTLTRVQDLLAPGQGDGGTDAIQTTVHAVNAGSYYLQVSDAHNVNFDATNAYTLTVGYAVDPDSHEPNDTTALAKSSDSKPGWIAYLGDLDVFKTTVAKAGDLLTISLTNPATANSPINYSITDSSGAGVGSFIASPSSTPLNTQYAVSAAGTYYVTLSYPMGATPSHSPSTAYMLSLGTATNPDTLNNHTVATAACPGGGTGPCSMAFSGSSVNLPTQKSYISVPGQRDYYRIDVTSGAALVLNISLTSSSSTTVKYAVDLLTPDPASPCQFDTDCAAMNVPCSSSIDDAGITTTTSCELSHACLPPGKYKFCPPGKACSLCQAADLCTPPATSGGMGVCLVPQYLSSFSPKGTKVGGPSVSTAQPLFSNGTYYVNVHDTSYTGTDLANPYSLTLTMVPEPDMYDQSTTASMRNNFYDPYPSVTSDATPNKARAADITAQLGSGSTVTGWISYQSDNDWYKFQNPCPGMNCAIDFNWTQPGPTMVHVAFFMLTQDLDVHESWGYDGKPSALSMPFSDMFANQSCSECSFASADAGTGPYTYYLRVADVSQTNWDNRNPQGQYTFSVKEGAVGCPAACSEPKGKQTPGCYCYCPDAGNCPSPKF